MPAPSQHAFSEKVVLVTGGTTPIGRAVAMQLALYGAFVVSAHREDGHGTSDLDELKSLGTLSASVAFEGRGTERGASVAAKVGELYGRLDLLVNCPLVEVLGDYDSVSNQRFSEVLEDSLESTFFIIKECKKLMIDRPKPKIVNIFPACDGKLSGRDVLLRSTSGAIEELTKVLSVEMPGHFRINGIKVSEAGFDEQSDTELDAELFRPKTGVDPDDVARTVLFLLSSEATGINGQILSIC